MYDAELPFRYLSPYAAGNRAGPSSHTFVFRLTAPQALEIVASILSIYVVKTVQTIVIVYQEAIGRLVCPCSCVGIAILDIWRFLLLSCNMSLLVVQLRTFPKFEIFRRRLAILFWHCEEAFNDGSNHGFLISELSQRQCRSLLLELSSFTSTVQAVAVICLGILSSNRILSTSQFSKRNSASAAWS